jgi:uncharacterized protein (TIGR00369 family)
VRNAEESQSAEAFIRTMLQRPPLHQWLLPQLLALDIEAGTATIGLPYRPELSRSPDQADYHGGIIATLIDMAGHACLAAKLRRRVPTIDMRIDFLRTAVNTGLRAEARILRAGRTIGLCDVEIRDDASRLISVGRCVYSTRES